MGARNLALAGLAAGGPGMSPASLLARYRPPPSSAVTRQHPPLRLVVDNAMPQLAPAAAPLAPDPA